MSDQVVIDREAPPWAQRLQTDLNALMARLGQKVSNSQMTGAGLQSQIDALEIDITAAESDITTLQGDVTALQAIPVLTSGTYTATTSGTSIDFTGIPAGTKRITVGFNDVSTNGTSDLIIQLGDSGGVETTSYFSHATLLATGSGSHNTSTAGFLLTSGIAATYLFSGVATLVLVNPATNTWSYSASGGRGSVSGAMTVSCGIKALSAELDRIRLTTVGGVNTFDAGGVNILYE